MSSLPVWAKEFSLEKLELRWRIIKSKKIVLVRPNCPGDTYTTVFSHPSAELVKTKAVAEGWTVTDLSGNNSNRANVETQLNTVKPNFVIHYDHGSNFTLFGQSADHIVAAIDDVNVNLLSGKGVSTVSCLSASGLGPLAVASTAKAYLGYDELHWVHTGYIDKFKEAANAANYALLEGKTFKEAYDIAYAKHTEKWTELVALGPAASSAAALMLHDRDHLTLLGNPNARAYSYRLFKVFSPLIPVVIPR